MKKDTHRDTVDCLLSELTDAYLALADIFEDVELVEGRIDRATASIERALQLVSDLAAQRD